LGFEWNPVVECSQVFDEENEIFIASGVDASEVKASGGETNKRITMEQFFHKRIQPHNRKKSTQTRCKFPV
jgi:hypothetical protein